MNAGFLIWNLPAITTCPGCTSICSSKCYAMKNQRRFPTCKTSREANLIESKKSSFFDEMVQAISQTVKSYKAFKGFFRIHESGDFYSQQYLNDWKEIAICFPTIKFLAFTKSFNLDFSNTPSNLKIIASIMPDTTLEAPVGFPKAFAGDCEGMENAIECPGNCDSCGMCWSLSELNKNVHFKMH